jgi:IS5 family transposase
MVIYSLHEPEVCCISIKNMSLAKSFILKTDTGVIVGALGFRNEFDGHTLKYN